MATTPSTEWSTGGKIAGAGLLAVVTVVAAVAIHSTGRCGRLQRWYEYAIRTGGSKDYEASLLRSEAGSRGCVWVKEIEDREEQDRYWRSRQPGFSGRRRR